MTLRTLIPMLNVSDIERSLTFYKDALGFAVVSDPTAVTEWRWCTIRSGGCELMLSESRTDAAPPGPINPHEDTTWPAIYYFYPDDIRALYTKVRKQGFQTTPLETTFYGMTEFSMQDPDGHLLSFGQDLEQQA